MSISLTYERVDKIFPGKHVVHALNQISFRIEPGELFCLLGPSGCGKTTLLRCTAGLERITNGRILYDDFDVTHVPPRKRNLGMVFQSFALYPHMNVYENVAFGLRVRKLPEEEIRKRVRSVMELVGMLEVLERNPSPTALSGGQQQRIAIARALVYDPKILLLDEPFANLDAKLRRYMRAEVRKIQKAAGVTAIFVTHDQEEAMAIGDRLAIMKDGFVEQIGTADDIYRTPNSMFVANFIGKMNFFRGTVLAAEKDSIGFRFDLGGQVWKGEALRTNPASLSLKPGDRGILGFRPERLTLLPKTSGYPEPSLSARVVVIQHLGQIVRYEVVLPSQQLTEIDMREKVTGVSEGDEILLSFQRTGAILFAETSEAERTREDEQ
ncbi:MAG: ABC transporter ATP-binding protein [Spirochaetales bacterium]